MKRPLAALAIAITLAAAAAHATVQKPAPTIVLRRGLVITKSAKVARQRYRLTAPASLDSALITIKGDSITLDLNGATILGADADTDPDRANGVAIRVEGGAHITIRNGTIHGYRVNILVRGTSGLTLDSLDLGQSWKPRLYSILEHESLADWLSYHHNEKREWLRFGAAAYLDSVSGGEIRAVTAEQGMNGLMLVRSDHLRIHDNTIRFNSGLGIGMYRSSDNFIVHNRLDYNVRGYSNGFYWRGQDSADLLMFEQSARNVVEFNSATHGGDGLFLWAGQSTMDTGEGGANDNLFHGNDFSFAPANAMEATFSRNSFIGNRAEGSDYGMWGGYSYASKVVENCFLRNRVGLAIEHGQDNEITSNHFVENATAIRLWGDKVEPSDWGYPKHRDTDSRNVLIAQNDLRWSKVGVIAANTRALTVTRNYFVNVDTLFAFKDTLNVRVDSNSAQSSRDGGRGESCLLDDSIPAEAARSLPHVGLLAAGVPSSPITRRDRAAIIVDEWGPYDWRTPKLWPLDSTHAIPLRLGVFGPEGRWRVVLQRGIAALSATAGRMNDTITLVPKRDSANDWALALEYRGAASRTPLRFAYRAFEPAQVWEVRVFAWSDGTDPRAKPDAFAALLRGTPLTTVHPTRLDYMWYKPKLPGVPLEKWALEATSAIALAPGTYTLRTISDDAVRVWVDGKLVIDSWTPHESLVDAVPLAGGWHELRVQYYQLDGWTELRLDILRGTERAGGSPGPH